MPPLRGLDLIVLCTPPHAALELAREALRAEVPCIDCSGALAGAPEVPLLVADLSASAAELASPAVAAPAGPSLAWALVLSALERSAGLRRIVGTVLQSAAWAGRSGIEALSRETVALIAQREIESPSVFPAQVAFDCLPWAGQGGAAMDPEAGGASAGELALVRDLERLLYRQVPTAVSLVQVPTFVGDGTALAVETERRLADAELAGIFEKAAGVEAWEGSEAGPTTRDTTGRDRVLVSRVRRDPSAENGLLLWAVADALRLAAANVAKLAEARLRLH
jgi:aspartate-semialdehyde dehydrogenase